MEKKKSTLAKEEEEEKEDDREKEGKKVTAIAHENFHRPFRKPRIMPADVRNNYCDVRRAYIDTRSSPHTSPSLKAASIQQFKRAAARSRVPRCVRVVCIRRYARCKLHM